MELYEEEPVDEDQVIAEVLGENPRARELRLMRVALEYRRDMFQRECESSKDVPERNSLRTRITELEGQIRAIRQEEEITTFVEGSVRVSLRNSMSQDNSDEFDEFDE